MNRHHRFWLPLLYITLFSVAVSAFCFGCMSWILRLRDPSEGINTFLLKAWIVIAAFGPAFFILLKLGIFH